MELTDKYPVNIENGIAVLGDDLEMFKMLLSHYDEYLTSHLQKLYEAIKIQDWDSVRRESNSLKGTTR